MYTLSGPSGTQDFSLGALEAMGAKDLASPYFDRGMDYQNSRFRAVPLASMVDRFDPRGETDAVLLNCFDDYQGIVSIRDIRRYDLHLATRIRLQPGFSRPSWLNPLLILVPEGREAPRQERFMTANIGELRFVLLDAYYAPLDRAVRSSEHRRGLQVFKDNCLFCHSLKGVGGTKGIRLLDRYDFSGDKGRKRFQADFHAFHHPENPDKQNLEQFVSGETLVRVAEFLNHLQSDEKR